MNLKLGEKWACDPHHIISNKIAENDYAPYVQEAQLVVEKLETRGQTSLSRGVEIETPHQSEKNLKRGSEYVIDLEEEIDKGTKRFKLYKGGSSS